MSCRAPHARCPSARRTSPLTGAGNMQYPLTGLDYGFDDFFNQHMWRMQVNNDPTTGDGQLYVGTLNSTTWYNSGPPTPARPDGLQHL